VDFVARKLDRAMGNEDWMDAYGQTSVEFLEDNISDHSTAFIMVVKVQSLINFSIFGLIMRDKGLENFCVRDLYVAAIYQDQIC
jgi:hypothetical protein